MYKRKFAGLVLLLLIMNFSAFAQNSVPDGSISPSLVFKSNADGFFLDSDRENGIVQGYIDTGTSLVYVPDLGIGGAVPASSFPAVVWTVDAAGNYSEPRGGYYEFPPVYIENPVPGNWTNVQMLVLSGAEDREVRWTIDGSDPNAGTYASIYRGPVRINRVGRIQLRVGWFDSEGIPCEDEVVFTVTGDGYIPGVSGIFDDLRTLEDEPITEPKQVSIPGSSLWAMGGKPDHAGGMRAALKPAAGVRRITALHLSADARDIESGEAESGIYRFVYLLDGIAPSDKRPSPEAPEKGESILTEQAGLDNSPPLKMVYSGRSRVLILSDTSIRYSWGEDGPWQSGEGVVCIPASGGLFRWSVGNQEPFRLTVPPLPNQGSAALTGFIGFRRLGPADDPSWHIASGNLNYSPQIFGSRILDACDGEDLEWAFLASDGRTLDKKRNDKLTPLPPLLDAPAEGSWTRGPVTIRLAGGGGEAVPVLSVLLNYASGREEILRGNEKIDIGFGINELVNVTINANIEDEAGNRGIAVIRRFTLDPKTIYAASPEFASGGAGQKGDRDNPFSDLEEALAYAKKEGLTAIYIGGSLRVVHPIIISQEIQINGSWDENLPSIILGEDAVFLVEDNAELNLSSLKVEKQHGLLPFITAGEGARVRISGSKIYLPAGDNRRKQGIVSKGAELFISKNFFDIYSYSSILFDVRGGSLKAEENDFFVSAESTAFAFILNDAACDLRNNTISVHAGDYASALEVYNSGLLLNSGSVDVSARDCTAILLDKTNAVFLNTVFTVKSSSLSQVMEIRGSFPGVTDCIFAYEGSARRTEVFAGADAKAPGAGTLGGSTFSHFSYIFGNAWPVSKLEDFNRAFAPANKPNTVLPAPAIE